MKKVIGLPASLYSIRLTFSTKEPVLSDPTRPDAATPKRATKMFCFSSVNVWWEGTLSRSLRRRSQSISISSIFLLLACILTTVCTTRRPSFHAVRAQQHYHHHHPPGGQFAIQDSAINKKKNLRVYCTGGCVCVVSSGLTLLALPCLALPCLALSCHRWARNNETTWRSLTLW